MKHTLMVLAALPALAACGDAADESDDPVATASSVTSEASADGTPAGGTQAGAALADTPDPAQTDQASPAAMPTYAGPPTPGAAAAPGNAATVPPTNQDAQYQDSVTEQPEVAP
jgi:hypothetical protein